MFPIRRRSSLKRSDPSPRCTITSTLHFAAMRESVWLTAWQALRSWSGAGFIDVTTVSKGCLLAKGDLVSDLVPVSYGYQPWEVPHPQTAANHGEHTSCPSPGSE